MAELQAFAVTKGLAAQCVQVDKCTDLPQASTSLSVLQFRLTDGAEPPQRQAEHFVLLVGQAAGRVYLVDPNVSPVCKEVAQEEVGPFFTGYALVLRQGGGFDRWSAVTCAGIAIGTLLVGCVFACSYIRNKRLRLTAFAFLLGASFASGAPAEAAIDPYAILDVQPSPLKDFGLLVDAPEGVLEHTFHLRNRSVSPISVNYVKATCSCLRAYTTSNTIDAGQTVDVSAELTVDGYRQRWSAINVSATHEGKEFLLQMVVSACRAGGSQSSPKVLSVEGLSSETAQPSLWIYLPGSFTPSNVLPADVVLAPGSHIRNIALLRTETWKLPYMRWDEEQVKRGETPKAVDLSIQGLQYDVTVELPSRYGTYTSAIEVSFPVQAQRQTLSVPVTLVAAPPIKCSDRRIFFGKSTGTVTRTLTIKSAPNFPLKTQFRACSAEPPSALETRGPIFQSENEMRFEFCPSPALPKGEKLGGTIRIAFGDASNPYTLEVPFSSLGASGNDPNSTLVADK